MFQRHTVGLLDFGRVLHFPHEFVTGWKAMVRSLLERRPSEFRERLHALGFVPKPSNFDFEHAYRMLLLCYRPCLTDRPFRHTDDHMRGLWKMYAADNPIEPILPIGGPDGLPWLKDVMRASDVRAISASRGGVRVTLRR